MSTVEGAPSSVKVRTVTFSRSATLSWEGDVLRGSGAVRAGTGAFDVAATFPSVRGEAGGVTTPEELLAASHAVCFGIGVRSVLSRKGGSATSVRTTATITAEKGPDGIRVRKSHLSAIVSGLQGIDPGQLGEIGREVKEECTISNALRGNVETSSEITSE